MKEKSPETDNCPIPPPLRQHTHRTSGFSHLFLAFGGYLSSSVGQPSGLSYTVGQVGHCTREPHLRGYCSHHSHPRFVCLLWWFFLEDAAKCVVLTKPIYYNQLLGVDKASLMKECICIVPREALCGSTYLRFALGHTWNCTVWFLMKDASLPLHGPQQRGGSGPGHPSVCWPCLFAPQLSDMALWVSVTLRGEGLLWGLTV